MDEKMQKIVSLAKRRGFVFPTSEIYGGLVSSYDYGPLGTELMRNIKNIWWKKFIQDREDMLGIDSQIILHPKTWEASGHVSSFSDPMVEDLKTHKRYRADHLIEDWLKLNNQTNVNVEDMSVAEMNAFILDNKIKSPNNNPVSEAKAFNLLFETSIGSVEDSKSIAYLRGETAQGIFSNFKNVLDSTRSTLPFGIGQLGKSFRNEITTGQFVFRTLEFEQAEIEYFFDPEETSWESLMNSWKESMWEFVNIDLGIKSENLRWRRHTDKERSHYSKDTYDLDYNFPFGFKELWGIAYRTDYDLKQHMEFSKQDLSYRNPYTNKKIVPHVIEPALGLNRTLLMVLCDSYIEEEDRVYLNLSAKLSPYKVAVFPLVSNKENVVSKAKEVFNVLKTDYASYWDDRGNIGKRYMYQDEIGTPFCVTVDYETLENNTVTIRDRDSRVQERVDVSNINTWIYNKIKDYK